MKTLTKQEEKNVQGGAHGHIFIDPDTKLPTTDDKNPQ